MIDSWILMLYISTAHADKTNVILSVRDFKTKAECIQAEKKFTNIVSKIKNYGKSEYRCIPDTID